MAAPAYPKAAKAQVASSLRYNLLLCSWRHLDLTDLGLYAEYCLLQAQVAPKLRYSLSPKAPPAITQESLSTLSRDEVTGTIDTCVKAGFSGREAPASNGALERRDFGKFVQFFRMSSSYIAGHRSRLFVICLPGEVGSLLAA